MYNNTTYQTEVTIRYGELKKTIDWCERNCTGDWGYSVIDEAGYSPGNYSFKFDLEKDYVTFLVWKK